MRFALSASLASILFLAATAAVVRPASAEDTSLLIWSPEKISDYAYRLRVGAVSPRVSALSAGVDLSIATSSTGTVSDPTEPAIFWTEYGATGPRGVERRVRLGLNALTGLASTGIGVSRTFMVTPAIDVVSERALDLSYDPVRGYIGSANARQSGRVALVGTGTSFVASGVTSLRESSVAATLAVEQSLFDSMSLRAAVSKESSSAPVGSLSASFSLRW
ncbi:hypothetical protein LXM94_24320 [Rhizobium sp. TRM95111]|uniref:hypothetical protein n=1 Tax=Rhizobium alarense TaxID=2846851 RepID=UPI001F2EEC39|nr:hypothetical protein [Rhizobium alarense]MCF3643090.1 hypothetical protein [Rhizobium alarense]